jgi:hypothetical protein
MKKTLLSAIFSIITICSFAQVSVEDSIIATPMIYGSFAQQFPGGDLKHRFGTNSYIGGGFLQKTKKNWMYGIDFNFLFGGVVKERDMFRHIDTQSGDLIDQNGALAEIRIFQRGYFPSIRFGRMFPGFGPNPNSGFFVLGGVGFLQHKIRIENIGNSAPQVYGEYKKGYDRLTNGLATSQFVGYMFLSNNRLLNFFGGVEFVQAFTQNRRFNYDTMDHDLTQRLDLLTGVKVGWVFPLYKKVPLKYYYY